MSAWTALLFDGFFISHQKETLISREDLINNNENNLNDDDGINETDNHQEQVDFFSSLIEAQIHYDSSRGLLVYAPRCRKLTWDYVTELSK